MRTKNEYKYTCPSTRTTSTTRTTTSTSSTTCTNHSQRQGRRIVYISDTISKVDVHYYKFVRIIILLQVLLFQCNNTNTIVVVVVAAMRIVVQRVKRASVTVDNEIVSQIGPGLVALVGIHENDTDTDLQYCCKRLINCKLFANIDDKAWRQSVKQMSYQCLLVSQFTLYGTLGNSKQYKPDYKLAMKTDSARVLYQKFVQMVESEYYNNNNNNKNNKNKHHPIEADDQYTTNTFTKKIQNGIFGAMMDVELVNDGPVTILIESNNNNNTIEGSSMDEVLLNTTDAT